MSGHCGVKIRYDPAKRAQTLIERGLDFDDALTVFSGPTFEAVDDRRDYGERRWQTYGLLGGRLVTIVWTDRADSRHIMSMRKCNEREQARFSRRLGS